ncbi:Reverse transcriptase precursor, partial [Phytophthora megakarya]
LMANFSKASGLQVNANKTVVVRLHSYTPTLCVQVYGRLKLQDVKRFSRYLGAQVGSRDAREHTWRPTIRQLGIRLLLASVKTLTEDQRATIAAAVVIPKLLYISRHAWPTVQ